MFRKIVILAMLFVATPLLAQSMPKYYPAEGFQRTGLVDAIYLDENSIVVNDMQLALSTSVVVHSMRAYRVSVSQVKAGVRIGYKAGNDGQVVEIWLLPSNYRDARKR